jgi:hypothetical protein
VRASPEVAQEYARNVFMDGATYNTACCGVYEIRDGAAWMVGGEFGEAS